MALGVPPVGLSSHTCMQACQGRGMAGLACGPMAGAGWNHGRCGKHPLRCPIGEGLGQRPSRSACTRPTCPRARDSPHGHSLFYNHMKRVALVSKCLCHLPVAREDGCVPCQQVGAQRGPTSCSGSHGTGAEAGLWEEKPPAGHRARGTGTRAGTPLSPSPTLPGTRNPAGIVLRAPIEGSSASLEALR